MIKLMKQTIFLFLFLLMCSINVNAQSQAAYINVGDKAFAKKDFVSALEFYKQALEFDDGDADLLFKMAETNRLLFSFEKALAWYHKAMIADRERKMPEIFLRYAEVLRYTGNFEEARNNIKIYHGLIANNDSLQRLAISDSLLIENSAAMMKDSVPAIILNAGNVVNSAYSDFAPQLIGDTTLCYSSMRFPVKEKKSIETVSKIMTANTDGKNFTKPVVLGDEIINLHFTTVMLL